MAIVFECIDPVCQQADNSFFVPVVNMTTRSTSTFATVLGYSEFANPSSPPKKYRTITVQGTSTRVAFTTEQVPRQCGGAKYLFSGVGQIDDKGNQLSRYTKNLIGQCSKQYWPLEPLQTLPGAIHSDPNFPPRFVGYCWPNDPQSCPVCDPNEANWGFLSGFSPSGLEVDLTAFLSNPPVLTKTSYVVNDVFHGITSITTQQFSSVVFGTDLNNYTVSVGSTNYTARAAVTNPPALIFPAAYLTSNPSGFGSDAIVGQYINFTDTNNYSAVLSDEYTDAMAMANASTVEGTGKVAQNLPRTTGFTSQFTTVVFTLLCKNLIPNRNYVAAVDFWDSATNITTTKQYPFTASAATNTIIDSIPTPPVGHSTQVKNPRIAFA